MKIAIITDQHFGARNDSPIYLDYYENFYSNIFFPTLEREGIDTILILGDTFDRRKYVNFHSLSRAKTMFFEPLKQKNIKVFMLIGNHDTYFKNTNELNSVGLLLNEYDNITPYHGPADLTLDGVSILMMPWICPENYEASMEAIKTTKSTICCGHFEISGFAMYKGMESHEGLGKELFQKFDMVFSGHYHHRSDDGHIYYLGNPYELTWSDYNDPRGFHLFDLATRDLQFVENTYRMFHKIHYNDQDKTYEEVMGESFEQYRGTCVKVIVHAKTNPYWFDMFIESLEKSGIANIQVVDDNLNLNLEDDDSIIDQAEDVITILNKYVDSIEMNVEKKDVYKLLSSLYNEAMTVGTE